MIESGKTYLINHASRGYFALRVTDTDSKHIHGEIVAGKVRCTFGVKSSGDRLKLKISECSKAAIPEEADGLVRGINISGLRRRRGQGINVNKS